MQKLIIPDLVRPTLKRTETETWFDSTDPRIMKRRSREKYFKAYLQLGADTREDGWIQNPSSEKYIDSHF